MVCRLQDSRVRGLLTAPNQILVALPRTTHLLSARVSDLSNCKLKLDLFADMCLDFLGFRGSSSWM